MVTKREVMTAGLPEEGVYRFRIDSFELLSGTSKKGNEWECLEMSAQLLETGGTKRTPAGPLPRPIKVRDRFWTSGKGVAKFDSLHKAVTGEMPGAEKGLDEKVELIDYAVELQGHEAWGIYVHGEPTKDDKIFGNFLYRFADNPDGVKFTPRS